MNNTFTVEQNGQTITYKVLLTFYNEALDKHYVVYTDESLDEKGNLNILVSSYDPDTAHSALMPIRSEEEWKVVTDAMNDFNEELMAQIEANTTPAMEIAEDEQVKTYTSKGVTYQVLAIFTNQQNGDEYAIYTDETPADENKQKEVLIGRIAKKDGDVIEEIVPVETLEEWEMIQEPANAILEHLNSK